MRDYFKLIRAKHYIKNALVFIPLFFGGQIFARESFLRACEGFLAFCMVSSAVYIINDYRDREKDRLHPTKKNRPLASGKIKPHRAMVVMAACLAVALMLTIELKDWAAGGLLLLYLLLNIGYSMGLKDRPIIDIIILASGFVIRVYYGAFITGISVSEWLYLVIITGSLYMGLGKRRNELRAQTETREVLKYYNMDFLDKNMYTCVALTDCFYALWALTQTGRNMYLTVPVFIILLMYYGFIISRENSDGDPVEVILHNKGIIALGLFYALMVFYLVYR